uniref:Uncharacterized protein n=1 Tax=Anopheles quadriannulatus TaxID=34691 RepID=A0A182XQF8_ANOQN
MVAVGLSSWTILMQTTIVAPNSALIR